MHLARQQVSVILSHVGKSYSLEHIQKIGAKTEGANA